MGATHVKVRVTNPADAQKYWEGMFLVDTGATDTLVPGASRRYRSEARGDTTL